MIFACYTGMGKSTLGEQREDVLDLPIVPFKYRFPPDYKKEDFTEADKANVPYDFIPSYPIAYVAAIKENILKYRHILIPSDLRVLKILEEEELDYVVCMPDFTQPEMKEVYRQRFIERGNTENFLKIFIGEWDYRMLRLENQLKPKILLNADQYVADAVAAYEEGELEQCPILRLSSFGNLQYAMDNTIAADAKFYRVKENTTKRLVMYPYIVSGIIGDRLEIPDFGIKIKYDLPMMSYSLRAEITDIIKTEIMAMLEKGDRLPPCTIFDDICFMDAAFYYVSIDLNEILETLEQAG